jgi:hypothetical protein
MLGQAHNRSMPFFDHLLQVRRVAVLQLFDRTTPMLLSISL